MSEDEGTTFAQDIEAEAGEPIEAIVIGGFGWSDFDQVSYDPDDRRIPMDRRGVVLSWEEARPLLDYEYDDDYGASDCHAVTVWSVSKVLWVTQYDGSTSISSAPRNPVAHRPEMPGG